MNPVSHTPGPWVAVELNEKCPQPIGCPIAVQRSDETYLKVGTICELVAQGDECYCSRTTHQNALLLAAAPDLLAACQAAYDAIEVSRDECAEIDWDRNGANVETVCTMDPGTAEELYDQLTDAIARAKGESDD